jgi:hypothetical protein
MIPGLKAAAAPLVDIGKSFSYGFDLPSNIRNDGVRGLVSGFRPHVGGALLGGAVGGYFGTKLDSVETAPATIGGAAIGGALLPAVGLAGAGAYGLGRGILNNSDKIVNGAVATGGWLGRAGMRAVTGPQFNFGPSKTGRFFSEAGNRLLNPVARHATTLNRAAENFVKIEPKRQVYDPKRDRMISKGGIKLKPLGWATIIGGGVIGATRSIAEAADSSRIGTRDTNITTATPRQPSYANDAGASGDLVFALNANRRG